MVFIMLENLLSTFNRKKKTALPSSSQDQIEDIPPLKDGKTLPENIEDFKEWHYKALKRLNKHATNEKIFGLISLEVDFEKFIPVLNKLGLLDWATYEESLFFSNNATLRLILKHYGLKVSGRKQDLVERILSNTDELDVRSLDIYSDYYVLTEKGNIIADSSFSKIEQDKTDFFKKFVGLTLDGKLNESYRMICKRNAEMPVPPGMGVDWKECYYEGLNEQLKIQSQDLLSEKSEKIIAASAIYGFFSDESTWEVANMFVKAFHTESPLESIYTDLETEISKLHNLYNLNYSNSLKVERYRFLATLDDSTCPMCGRLDGKIFLYAQSKVGVNYPPIHKGCRCTTISDVDKELLDKWERFARDPVTGRPIKVPANMTWEEWKREYF